MISNCRLRIADIGALLLVAGLGISLVSAVPVAAQQKPDRSKPPAIGPAPSLKLPAIQKQKLSNGLAVWIVEHHEVPLAQINLIVRSGSAADPIGKFGVGNLAAAMLDEGAGTRSALDLADALEFLGANLSTTSSFDYSSIRLSVPVSKLGDALPLMADVALRPTFPAAELDRLRKERLTQLLQARDNPAALIQIAFPRIIYGPTHRYGTPAKASTTCSSAIVRATSGPPGAIRPKRSRWSSTISSTAFSTTAPRSTTDTPDCGSSSFSKPRTSR